MLIFYKCVAAVFLSGPLKKHFMLCTLLSLLGLKTINLLELVTITRSHLSIETFLFELSGSAEAKLLT